MVRAWLATAWVSLPIPRGISGWRGLTFLFASTASWASAVCMLVIFAAGVAIGCGSEPNESAYPPGGHDASIDVSKDAGIEASAESAIDQGHPIEASNDSIASDSTSDTMCVPKTCAQLGAACGSLPDGCGTMAECGTCPAGQICGGAGPNQCGAAPCTPKTCAQVGATCGLASDGCDSTISCGTCSPPGTCGGAGVDNQCGCSPSDPCGTTACAPDACSDSTTFNDFPATCQKYCTGVGTTCGTCTCTATITKCTAKGCCAAHCNATGCSTTNGACPPDTCTASKLTYDRTCSGCGANGATGTCSAGTSVTCGASNVGTTQACGGSTYKCTNHSTPAPGSQDFTTVGTFTFTVPAYDTLTVKVWGGGGGGGGGFYSFASAGGPGGASSFKGTVVANGGAGGAAATLSTVGGGAGGTASGGTTNTAGANGASSGSGGGVGGSCPNGGVGGTAGYAGPGGTGGTPGGGGGGGSNHGFPQAAGGGGGGGGYSTITYTPGQLTVGSTITVVVGAGGTQGTSGDGTIYGGAGGPGKVSVSWTHNVVSQSWDVQ